MLTPTTQVVFTEPIYLPPPEIPVQTLPLLPAPAKRKRGAQPGNQNARRKQPPDTAALKTWLGSIQANAHLEDPALLPGPASPSGQTYIDLSRQLRRKQYASMQAGINEFTEISQVVGDHFEHALRTNQHKATGKFFKVLITCANGIDKFASQIIHLTYQDRTLAKCADHAFLARRPKNPAICVFKHSFIQNPDTLSTYAGQPECPVSFINDRQWFLIEPLITDQVAADGTASLRKRDPSKQQRASRAVPWPQRFLLDGILWKLATACTWSELPAPYPVRRCQKLFQSLHKSGRIGHIITLLHEDFNAYGDLSLKEMALNGEYMVWGSKILYIPHGKHTWQGLVTLLLLQSARRELLTEQRNKRRICLDERSLPRLPRIPGFASYVRKFVKRRKLVPPGILHIPPPFKHPSLKHLPSIYDHPNPAPQAATADHHMFLLQLARSVCPPDAGACPPSREP